MKEEHDDYKLQQMFQRSSSSRLSLVEIVGTDIQKPVKGEGYGILLPAEQDESEYDIPFTDIKYDKVINYE